MAAPFLLKALPVFRLRLLQHHHRCRLAHGFVTRRFLCGAESPVGSTEGDKNSPSLAQIFNSERTKQHPPEWENSGFRTWKDEEAEILEDIEPIMYLTKEILHSNRYKDGEPLTPEDEKLVVEKLLAHHPRSQDKIGSGLDSIMVDRHPQFRHSRCLFVVRTDGGWIDFSYQKCLREYIRNKYPSHAERFINTHLKRGRS